MNAKEYLSQAIWLNRVINNKLEQKEELETLAQRTTVDCTQEKVSGGRATTSPISQAVIVRIRVLGRREVMRSIAGVLYILEYPKSPVMTLFSQVKYLTGSGSSR